MAAKKVQVRVLADLEINCASIPCGRVAALDSDVAEALIIDLQVDATKAAVDYALSENPEVIDA